MYVRPVPLLYIYIYKERAARFSSGPFGSERHTHEKNRKLFSFIKRFPDGFKTADVIVFNLKIHEFSRKLYKI